MCIALLSTQHPQYPLIILNNRDEFLHRPTLRASWWDTPSTSHIFSGRDLARPERGTWLGITRNGRIAILTNFRESSSAAAIGTRSRGAMVNSFLTTSVNSVESTKEWAHRVLTANGDEGVNGVGGFSLICGIIHPKKHTSSIESGERVELEPLAVISNRNHSNNEASWICDTINQVHALSNSLFEDKDPWPKVRLGKKLLSTTVEKTLQSGASEDEFLEDLFGVLSHDTLPVPQGKQTYNTDLWALQQSVFITAFIAHEESGKDDEDSAKGLDASTNGISHDEQEISSAIASTPHRPRLNTAKISTTSIRSICATPISPTFNSYDIPHAVSIPNDSPRFYGTQKQTVILVDRTGRVKYVERTLYDEDARWVGGPDNKDRDTVCEFMIEGWNA